MEWTKNRRLHLRSSYGPDTRVSSGKELGVNRAEGGGGTQGNVTRKVCIEFVETAVVRGRCGVCEQKRRPPGARNKGGRLGLEMRVPLFRGLEKKGDWYWRKINESGAIDLHLNQRSSPSKKK